MRYVIGSPAADFSIFPPRRLGGAPKKPPLARQS